MTREEAYRLKARCDAEPEMWRVVSVQPHARGRVPPDDWDVTLYQLVGTYRMFFVASLDEIATKFPIGFELLPTKAVEQRQLNLF